MPFESVNPDDIRQAAELRAQGHPWDAVAKAMGRKCETIRKWQWRLGSRWTKAYARAIDEERQHAVNESYAVLRNQLRPKDDKLKGTAAATILKHDIAKTKPLPKDPKPVTTSAVRMAEYLEGLSDAELETILHTVAEDSPATPAVPRDGVAGTPAATSPDGSECVPAVLLRQPGDTDDAGQAAS